MVLISSRQRLIKLISIVLAFLILISCNLTTTAGPTFTPPADLQTPAAGQSPSVQAPVSSPTAQKSMAAFHRSGQTFLTWPEDDALQGEIYRVYRSDAPIDAANLSQARLLAQTGKDSARFYASRYTDTGHWQSRYSDRLIIQDGGAPVPKGVGLLVWTLAPQDLGGKNSGAGYYAVTVTPLGGREDLPAKNILGPVQEEVSDPLPVEITHSPGVKAVADEHIYIQYMDLRHWNATFHAPNPSNDYYGLDASDPAVQNALAYAYDYVIFTPPVEKCGKSLSGKLPALIFLHGYRTNRYNPMDANPYPYCAYGVYPVDQSETWYFGFARDHDFRKGVEIAKGDVIVNYTEQRVLRMLYDLLRQPPGPPADPQRLYVFGHSMGGSGTLGLAERYPNVFAAAYAGEPISNYRTAGVTDGNDWAAIVARDWGSSELNLPVEISAPGGWANALQKYNGTGVWKWQNYQANMTLRQPEGRASDPMVPLGIDYGLADPTIDFTTQGKPFFPLLNRSPQAWAGAATSLAHEWSDFIGLPPSMGMVDKAPFWNFHVLRDESVPAFSGLSSNNPNPPSTAARYNQLIKWSSSWDAWDGAPVDETGRWQMSFCTVARGSFNCGTGVTQSVDVTPRRVQAFSITPGASYDWENRQVGDNRLVAHGTVKADSAGLITVKNFLVTTGGNRLILKPH